MDCDPQNKWPESPDGAVERGVQVAEEQRRRAQQQRRVARDIGALRRGADSLPHRADLGERSAQRR